MKFRNKFLIYLLTAMMVLPTWLVTGLINAPHAKAFFHPDATVVYVTSTNPDGSYGVGSNINVSVSFSEEVRLIGSCSSSNLPKISLRVSPTTRYAYFTGFAGGLTSGSVANFNYTVSAGDTASDLNYYRTDSLTSSSSCKFADNGFGGVNIALPSTSSVNSLGGNKDIALDTVAPTITIAPYNTNPTNQDITVYASTDEGTLNAASHTFTENGSFSFIATDSAGNQTTRPIVITNIDKVAPKITIAPYTTTPTNQDITVYASTDEGTLNTTEHTFTGNSSFDFVATDAVGNVTTVTITITNIDKVAPKITIAPYTTTPTNQDITVYASTDEGTLNAASHTFTENGSFDFVATDAAGNVTTETVDISNIDKTIPEITSLTGTAGTTGETTIVSLTATDNTEIAGAGISIDGAEFVPMESGDGSFIYNVQAPLNSVAPITYTVKVVDAAGNSAEQSATIIVTDNDRPIIDSVVSSPDTTGDVTTITIDATDNIGIVGAQININNAGWVTLNGSMPTFTFPYRLSDHDLSTIPYKVRVADAAGNHACWHSEIVPEDNDAPVIVLNGDLYVTVERGTEYIDAGASASDNIDGDLTSDIATVNNVNTAIPGDYTVTYDVSDFTGNEANQVVRYVNVSDTIAPKVTVNSIITASTTPAISGEIDDQTADVYVSVDGTEPILATKNVDGTWALLEGTIAVLTEGEHKVTVQAVDPYQNWSVIAEGTITVDLAAGVPQITASGTGLTINLTWVDEATDTAFYEIYAGPDFTNLVLSATNIKAKNYAFNVANYGIYAIKVIAVDSVGNKSIDKEGVNTKTIELVAPVAAVEAPAAQPSAPVVSKPAPATQTPTVTTPSDDNGIIKGEETAADEEEKVNWTPWIILFILILLAGAITGGYFYWFAGADDDKAEEKKPEKTVEKKIVPPVAATKKKNNKKQKRW